MRCDLPLGVAVVRKLGAPAQEEFAIGAIAEGVRVVNPDAIRGVTPEQLAVVEDLERIELRRRTRLFAPAPIELAGRVAMIVDDGVATGATATAACRAVRAAAPAQIVLAVPVAPAQWRPEAAAVDAFVCPHPMRDFWAVGQFYEDFTQTTDEEVARLLRRASTGSATDVPDRRRSLSLSRGQPISAARSVSSPTPPISSARLWKSLIEKASPCAALTSSRTCSQMRWPTLYAGACPGQPR